jgi:hypothetical protein
LNGAV